MKLATERQKVRLRELDIDFDETMTLEEAAELIRAESKQEEPKRVTKEDIGESSLMVAAEWEL